MILPVISNLQKKLFKKMITQTITQPSSFLHTGKPEHLEFKELELPGITKESKEAVLKLLDQNHKNFDIFYNNQGFHNHCAHHLLAAYSCGASPEVLESIYKKSTNYLRPRKPSQLPITQENWETYLGKME